MAIMTYQANGQGAETVLIINVTEESKINLVSVKADVSTNNLVTKRLLLRYYLDGTNLTNEIELYRFYDKFNLFSDSYGLAGHVFGPGVKLEFIVLQEGPGPYDPINITVNLMSGAAVTGVPATTGYAFDIGEGVLTVGAGATEVLILREYDGLFSVKSAMLDTSNKNVTIRVMYDINDSYRLVEEQIFNNVEKVFTWTSPLVTKAVRFEITNNGSSSINIDWNKTLILY